MVAGPPRANVNKRIPPTIGVGIMRFLSKHFPVMITPEAYTSKTCFFCDGMRSAVAHGKMRHTRKDRAGNEVQREIRGLRVCNNEDCSAHSLNRDLNASLNIAKRAWCLLHGLAPPHMDAVNAKLRDDPHLRMLCAACDDEG